MSDVQLASVTPRVFAGRVQPMPGDGRPTAIFKQPLHGEIEITPLGIVGDHQADLKHHGGPEKAVHFYAADRYALLAQRFPDVAGAPGPRGLPFSIPFERFVGDMSGGGDQVKELLASRAKPYLIIWAGEDLQHA